MGFLSGSISFDTFRIEGKQPRQFTAKHLETLQEYGIADAKSFADEQAKVGFLAGGHLLDYDFSEEKNIFVDALHFGIRVDTNQVPAAVRRAWLQIELAVLTADSMGRRPTKAQRQEAQEAVQAQCDDAAASGQFQRMSQFPVLWDAQNALLYCGATSSTAIEVCGDLMSKAFNLELRRLSSSRIASEWATGARRVGALNDALPASFLGDESSANIGWWGGEKDNYEFLGNEFLVWLWWFWDSQDDVIKLSDGSELDGMFSKTISLECPLGESGKGTFSSEDPTDLPEAAQALRSGKLPRKAGLLLVRNGEQYELTLQAETFSVGGAKIVIDEDAEGRGILEDRIDALRELRTTLNLLFEAFCERRTGKAWPGELKKIRAWLTAKPRARQG